VLTAHALHDGTLAIAACAGAVVTAYDGMPTDRIFKPGWSTNPAVSGDDAANEPGQSPISAPVLVVQGTDDSLIPYATTTHLVDDTLCGEQHDTVRYVPVAGAGHDGALVEGTPIIVPWIAGRLSGTAATDTCPDSGTQPTG
jgi:pimeloyl-ACP methyl ester carboxylesterase